MLNIATSVLHEVKHEARDQDANNAQGETKCFIIINQLNIG